MLIFLQHYHFTDDIQTRQYRSLEVLLGVPYTYSAGKLMEKSIFIPVHQFQYFSRHFRHLEHGMSGF